MAGKRRWREERDGEEVAGYAAGWERMVEEGTREGDGGARQLLGTRGERRGGGAGGAQARRVSSRGGSAGAWWAAILGGVGGGQGGGEVAGQVKGRNMVVLMVSCCQRWCCRLQGGLTLVGSGLASREEMEDKGGGVGELCGLDHGGRRGGSRESAMLGEG